MKVVILLMRLLSMYWFLRKVTLRPILLMAWLPAELAQKPELRKELILSESLSKD